MNAPNHPMDAIVARYRKFYTGLVYDILDELGHPNQVLATDLRPIRPDMVVAGPAFTIQMIADPVGDPELAEKRINLFKAMSYPCVDVRDCGFDTRVANYGEMNATLGRKYGSVGAIIDGGVRDTRHLLDMDFPVPVTLRGASIGLIGETSSVRGLTVANPKGYTDPDFASLGQASLSARLGELMAETATIRNITIRDLTVTLEKDAQGKLNVDRISENLPDTGGDKPAAPKPDAGPSRVIVVQEFRMESVKVRLRDLVGGKKGVVEAKLPDIVLRDVKSDGSVDVLASELSGVVIGSVLQATVSANIEGLSDEVVGGLRNALKNSVSALPTELQGPVETIRGGVGEVLDKAGEGLKEGIGGALDGILGGKKNGR